MASSLFRFQQFEIRQDRCAMKVGMDGVLLGAWAQTSGPVPASILDIGTGTGLLALMLAQRFPTAQVDAVEVNEEAAQQAQENVQASPFYTRVQVFAQSIQDFLEIAKGPYDLIVSNPPYFSGSLPAVGPSRRLARHTIALTHAELLSCVHQLLRPQGRFCVILPFDTWSDFEQEANRNGLWLRESYLIRPRPNKNPNRILLQFAKERSAQGPQEGGLSIYAAEEGEVWSHDFIALTKSFYLALQ